MSDTGELKSLQNQLDVMLKFPDQNPNPVLKTSLDGKLQYSNKAGREIQAVWGIEIGESVPCAIVNHTKSGSARPLEMGVGNKTFSFHIVPVHEFDFINIYGTDVTAVKAITKFPDQNPNPVIKISLDGELLYVNEAGDSLKQCGRYF